MTALREVISSRFHSALAAAIVDPDADVQDISELQRELILTGVTRLALEQGDLTLGQILPTLSRIDRPIPPERFDVRSQNALFRAGIRVWSELAELAPAAILSIRNVGVLTVQRIVHECVTEVLSTPVDPPVLPAPTPHHVVESSPAPDFVPNPTIAAVSAAELRIAKAFRYLAEWAVTQGAARSLAGLLIVGEDEDQLPPDVRECWSMLMSERVADLAPVQQAPDVLAAFLRSLQEQLGDSRWQALNLRLAERKTLEASGRVMGLTRERVRQLQVRAEKKVRALLREDRFRTLRWRIWAFRRAVGTAAPLGHETTTSALRELLRGAPEGERELAKNILLGQAGPFVESDGWLFLDGDARSAGPLKSTKDEFGRIPRDAVDAFLADQGVRAVFIDDWLKAQRLRDFGPFVADWSASIIDRCVTCLAVRGVPATVESLLEELGESHNIASVRQRFFADERLMRVSPSTWALRAWGGDEYSGIADEIAERILARGGSISVDELVTEITETFGVRGTSVRVYARAPMFVVEQNRVRLRRSDEDFVVVGSLSDCRGAFRYAPHGISFLADVDSNCLRGSGFAIRDIVARELGVLPGGQRSFRGDFGTVIVSWPRTAFAPWMGSTRAAAQSVNATEGDHLRLDFDLARGYVSATLVPADLSEVREDRRLPLLTAIDPSEDWLTALGVALGVAPADVRRVLIARGDAPIADLLPEPQYDPALEAAIRQLAATLEGAP